MHRYLDLFLILIAAPILALVGVPVVGYGVGAAAWIMLRGLGHAVDRRALATRQLSQLVALRMGYRFTRVALLVLAVVLAQKWIGPHDGLAALLVIAFGFTVQLGESILYRGEPHLRDRAPRAGCWE